MSNTLLPPFMVTRVTLKRKCWTKNFPAANQIEVLLLSKLSLTTIVVKTCFRSDGAYWYLQRSTMKSDSKHGMRTWRGCETCMKEAPNCDKRQYHSSKGADGDGT